MVSSELKAQLVELVLQAVFWWVFIKYVGTPLVKTIMRGKPFLAQWIDFNAASIKNFGIKLDRPETFDFSCEICAIMMQHTMSALLCLPSVLGIAGWAFLAPHGALCEAGNCAFRVFSYFFSLLTSHFSLLSSY